eukprot:m.447229 g.447229  ORF g.447229 m.447229 type:complete len:550 (-) comp20315_c0_seq2:137-1786(-)
MATAASADLEQQHAMLDSQGVHLQITTSSAEAQQWFDRGLLWLFAFTHEYAADCFQQAIDRDGNCGMAHWGLCYANAGNYNHVSGMDTETCLASITRAAELTGSATPIEQALIRAAVTRFVREEGKVVHQETAYAESMMQVFEEFGSNPHVASLSCEACMNIHPWKLWDPETKEPTSQHTLDAVAIAEKGLATHPDHPGLCHLYIHCMELSGHPEKALAAANHLRRRVPTSGHLVHMPSHIYVWLGQYKDAVDTNRDAVQADTEYCRFTGRILEFFTGYRLHNYHFVCWAAMLDGQYSVALRYARDLEKQVTEEAVRFTIGNSEVGRAFVEPYAPMAWHVLIRFGRWHDILKEPIQDKTLFPTAFATAHYARGIAFAALGQVREAEEEREVFRDAVASTLLDDVWLHNNPIVDRKAKTGGILDVATCVLDGEIDYRKGNYEAAFDHLREAVRRDTNLHYDEPWGWMMSTRHPLGALLLEQGQAKEACQVFQADLEQFPNNLWALGGLSKAQAQLGNADKAEELAARAKEASARADVPVHAACFCASRCT